MTCHTCGFLGVENGSTPICAKTNVVVPGGLLNSSRRKAKAPEKGCVTPPVRRAVESPPKMNADAERQSVDDLGKDGGGKGD